MPELTEQQRKNIRITIEVMMTGAPTLWALMESDYLDLEPPTEYLTKKELFEETKLVSEAMRLLDELFGSLFSNEANLGQDNAYRKLGKRMNALARTKLATRDRNSVLHWLLHNVADYSTFHFGRSFFQLLLSCLHERETELKAMERLWPEGRGKPKNLYAYAIAYRLARIYFRGFGVVPTYGAKSGTKSASTKFTRALEIIFENLGIASNVIAPTKEAIRRIEEEERTSKPRPSLLTAYIDPKFGGNRE